RKSDAELAQEVAAFRFSTREQRNGPHEQSRRTAAVTSLPGGDAGAAEASPGILRELTCVSIRLRPERRRLLEVEADQFVVADEDVGEPLVDRRALRPRRDRVRSLLDQGMTEAEPLLERRRRRCAVEEPSAHERRERLPGGARLEQLGDERGVELPADDRRVLDRRTLARGQPVEARGEQR